MSLLGDYFLAAIAIFHAIASFIYPFLCIIKVRIEIFIFYFEILFLDFHQFLKSSLNFLRCRKEPCRWLIRALFNCTRNIPLTQGSKYRSKSDCEAKRKRKFFREKLRSEAKRNFFWFVRSEQFFKIAKNCEKMRNCLEKVKFSQIFLCEFAIGSNCESEAKAKAF